MAEEIKQDEVVTQELHSNPFDDSTWSSNAPEPVKEEKKDVVVPPVEKVAQDTPPKVEEEIVEPGEWLKREFGWDSLDAAKQELETLRKPKEAAELKFANEDSRKLFESLKEGKEDEIYNILTTKRQLARADSLDLSNASQAAEILRLNFQLRYPNLAQDEINDLFSESYQKPEKPAQSLDMDDDEYSDAVKKWQSECEKIDKRVVRDAKIAKPELQKLKNEIVLPDIKKEDAPKDKALTLEEQQAAQRFKDNYLQTVATSTKEFTGFSAAVKDKDVDFAVTYAPSVEEVGAVEKQLKDFAEKGFDANALFADRWLKEDGSINAQKMTEDLSLLMSKDRVLQKVATDAANQRLAAYIKDKKQSTLKEKPEEKTTALASADTKTEQQNMAEFFWNQ